MAAVADVMTKKFLKMSASDSLSKAIGKMQKRDQRTAVIFDKKKYKGVVARRELLMARVDPVKSKIKEFIKYPPVVSLDTDLVEAAELMYHAYPCVLIVQRDKKFLGIVRARDFIHKIKEIPQLAKLKVSEIMTPNPIVFNYNDRLGDALSVMREKRIGRAPVVDKLGRIISVLSFTDIARLYLLHHKKKIKGHEKATLTSKGSKAWTADKLFLLDTNVGDEASRIIITVSPSTRLAKAIDEMYNYKISDIIVTKAKKPVGIITTRNLLETYVRLRAPEYWPIYYYGLKRVKPFQGRIVRELVQEAFEKIRRAYFRDIIYLVVHVKLYEEGHAGKAARKGRTKWSIRLRLATPAHVFVTEHAHFYLSTALSWALKELEMKLQKFKVKTRERFQETGKKGRRAMFERFIRKKKDDTGGLKPFSPLIKRK